MFINVIFTSWTFNTKRYSGGENKLTPHVVLICVDGEDSLKKKNLKKMFVRFHFANFYFYFLNALFCKDVPMLIIPEMLLCLMLHSEYISCRETRGQFFLFLLLSSLTSGFLCFHLLEIKGTFWEMCRFAVRSVIILIMSIYLTKWNVKMSCFVWTEVQKL